MLVSRRVQRTSSVCSAGAKEGGTKTQPTSEHNQRAFNAACCPGAATHLGLCMLNGMRGRQGFSRCAEVEASCTEQGETADARHGTIKTQLSNGRAAAETCSAIPYSTRTRCGASHMRRVRAYPRRRSYIRISSSVSNIVNTVVTSSQGVSRKRRQHPRRPRPCRHPRLHLLPAPLPRLRTPQSCQSACASPSRRSRLKRAQSCCF